MNFKTLINKPEYDFLRTNPRLGPRIMLLGVSGSYGYGTNREGSDIDLRGVTLNLPSDLLGLTQFEQFEDRETDTVIYSFTKLVNLLLNCNPNSIEMLGLDEEQYLIKSELGQELLDNRHHFLSKRAAASFGHYADAQLRRLQNAIARDTLPQPDREQHILESVQHALDDFNRRHTGDGQPGIEVAGCAERGAEAAAGDAKPGARLFIDKAETEGLETEIFVEGTFAHYPLRKFTEMANMLGSVLRDYDRIGKRNHKKDDRHLNKHAMHLVRLFMMGIDILKKEEIRTHRPETDLVLLRSIRDGEYMRDGVLTEEFYRIVSDYERRFEEAERTSLLPDNPDMEWAESFVESVNRRAVEDHG